MNLTLRYLLLLICFFSFLRVHGQKPKNDSDTTSAIYEGPLKNSAVLPGGQGHMPNVIPPSPNMSSLGKFIEHPVNNYTGIPTIKIPIYNIKHRDINVPIEVNYHSSGNKVETQASWVGLGWSLGIGSITRSVRGLPDDLFSIRKNVDGGPGCVDFTNVGYLYCAAEIESMYNETNTDSPAFLDDLREVGMGAKDGTPDLFYFTFGKYSGHFVFGPDGNINIVPQQDLHISVRRPDGKEITGFTVLTPEGIEYVFNDIERSMITSTGKNSPLSGPGGIEDALALSGPFFGVNGGGAETDAYCDQGDSRIAYNSSWQLTKIVSAKSGEEVTFSYREEKSHVQSYSGETLFWWTSGNDNTAFRIKSAVSNYVKTKVIESVTWPTGYVQFKIDLTDPRLIQTANTSTKKAQESKPYIITR